MFRRTLTIAALFASPALSQASIAPPRMAADDVKSVRVLLGHFPRITVSGFDLEVNQNETLEGSSVFTVRCAHNEIEYGLKKMGRQKLEIKAPGNFFTLDNKTYRGALTITAENNSCVVVNTLDLEKYVSGLINREMSPSWPMEALKAQAVASRTYALYQMNANRTRNYDVENTVQDQVYDDAASETSRSSQAVQSTRGMTLTWRHTAIKAFFHADCGGKTENPEQVWGEKYGYLKPVICPYHTHASSQKHWIFTATLTQLDHALHKMAGLLPKNFVRLASLEAGPQDDNNRLSDLIVSDQAGHSAVISANTFRNAMGTTKVKSTSFVIKRSGNAVELTGNGYGHGVGMCQVGAREMANEGHSYQDILHFYYPLAKLERLQ